MRWEGQSTKEEAERRLPGLGRTGTIRTFDAPEAMGVRFHEVEAKSALNRVPGNGLPFDYTVNPYRGCAHACTYCASGATPVLTGDGRHKPLSDLRVGDSIYGTVRIGSYRRYVLTEVMAHWTTSKPAYRITLEDGTSLIASGDHRFLSDRGWKHVTGSQHGATCRPHLTLNNKLTGVGKFVANASQGDAYRRGYLAGMVRGDGHVGGYEYERAGRRHGNVHRFRLALADREGLDRAQRYLTVEGVSTNRFLFTEANQRHREVTAIRNQSRDGVQRVRDLIAWPTSPCIEWSRGFLAGIFDAEGSYLRGILRISNTDPEMLGRTSEALAHVGLPSVLEPGKDGSASTIRVTEGLRSHLSFFHQTDPAIPRKRAIVGIAVKSKSRLGIVEIEPLPGSNRLYDITTGTGDFIADGVISHNCFARPTHRYLDLNAREDFEREIVVKVNVPERLRAELARPSWKGDTIALGTNTDPYQWVEGRYGLTRAIWEVMIEARNPGSVLTKSPLLLRDVDLFKQLNAAAGFQASLSIPTLDEAAWRASEPRTPHPRKRIEAVAELTAAGIPAAVLIAPLMPGINDSPAQVEKILELCAEAGARSVGGLGLHLKGEVREIFLDWLRGYRPDLLPRYEELYAGGAFLPRRERDRITGLVAKGRRKAGLRAGSMEERRNGSKRRPAIEPEAEPEAPRGQRSLF